MVLCFYALAGTLDHPASEIASYGTHSRGHRGIAGPSALTSTIGSTVTYQRLRRGRRLS